MAFYAFRTARRPYKPQSQPEFQANFFYFARLIRSDTPRSFLAAQQCGFVLFSLVVHENYFTVWGR